MNEPADVETGGAMSEMAVHADKAAELLRALASPHRLMVLCALCEGEHSVRDLNAKIGLTQSALSQHLAVLRAEKLVTTRRSGQTIYYAIAQGPALSVVKLLYAIYCARPGPAERAGSSVPAERGASGSGESGSTLRP